MLFNSLHLNESRKHKGMVCMSHSLILEGKNLIVSRDYGQERLMYSIICKNRVTSDAIRKDIDEKNHKRVVFCVPDRHWLCR